MTTKVKTKKGQTWTTEETTEMLHVVLGMLRKGFTLDKSIRYFTRLSGRTYNGAYARWSFVKQNKDDDYVKAILKICRDSHGDPQNDSWSVAEEKELVKAVGYCYAKGKIIDDAFKIASKRLERTESACSTRWYKLASKRTKVIEYIERCKKAFEENKQKATE